ncbi:hypothetical protein [Chitinivorax sp. B]|uniref:hypothetical protein n=1 Tax=Chitinivorax sp. B TaxID=2502235 RepID=UPI0010F55D1D|nr:hypothetical protein [Chitinivorax sp. B]
MLKHQLLLPGLVAVLATFILALYWIVDPSPEQPSASHWNSSPRQADLPIPTNTTQTVPAPMAVDILTSGRLPGNMPPDNLALSFGQATSYRQFIELALKHPEQGGYLYAQSIMARCDGLVATLANTKPATLRKEQLAMQVKISERCDMSTAEILEMMISRPGLSQQDPLYRMRQQLSEVSLQRDMRARSILITQALASKDPQLLLESPGFALTRVDPFGQGNPPAHYFNGKWLNGEDSTLFAMAKRLAACAYGQPCHTDHDPWLMGECAISGHCYADRAAYIEAQIVQGRPAHQKKLWEYVTAIRDAIDHQNVSAWVPVN